MATVYFEGVAASLLPMHRSVTPRWVWLSWATLLAALALALLLWVVHVTVDGVIGPVVAGVYITGPIGVAVLAVYITAAAAMATIAAIMIGRVSENRIGWILGGMALWMVTSFLVVMVFYFFHGEGEPGWHFANWLGAWSFVLAVPSSLVLMFFPSGHLLSPRWRLLPWLAVAGTVGWAISEASGPGLGLQEELFNPLVNSERERIGDIISVLFFPAIAGTVASLIVRYRRASPDIRLQIKWVGFGGVLQIAVLIGASAVDMMSRSDFPIAAVLIGVLSMLIVPLALTVAILRFRLYAIDRLVSRTASYAVLVALLAGGTFGVVLGTQALFSFTSDLVVAGTTLALVAVFNPMRLRLHRTMDRRFNRRRFDAERVAEAFAARVGAADATDDLLVDLEAIVEKTIAPATFGIWIRH
jgi:hypothetical protein